MIITYGEAYQRFNSANLSPLYLFFGEEPYLREKLLFSLQRAYLSNQAPLLHLETGRKNLDLEQVFAATRQAGLFGDGKLVTVDVEAFLAASSRGNEVKDEAREAGSGSGTGKEFRRHIDEYLSRAGAVPPTSVVVFLAGRVDRRKSLFKVLTALGTAVECPPLKGSALAAWLERAAEKRGLKIHSAAREQLLLSAERGLYYLSTELDKCAAYLEIEQPVVTLEVLDSLSADSGHDHVFNLTDAIAEKDFAGARRILAVVLSSGESPLFLFHMIARHFRLLLKAHSYLARGVPLTGLAGAMQVHSFVARKAGRQAQAYSRNILENAIVTLQQLDVMIKQGHVEPAAAIDLVMSRVALLVGAGSSFTKSDFSPGREE